jgi:hypothetical protein
MPKNRHEQCGDEAAELPVNMLRQDRRFADQDAGDERTEDILYADPVGDQRHADHDQKDDCDNGEFAFKIIVGPPDQLEHDRATDRKARNHE